MVKKRERGTFKVGEKVLVPHTDKFYEAKVTKVEKREQGIWHYLLHYQGWNKKWDEWVDASGVVKYSSELAAEGGGGDGGPPGKRRQLVPGDTAPQSQPDSPVEEEEKPIELKVQLPAALLKQLVEEWECITKQDSLAPLPRRPCIDTFLSSYVEQVVPRNKDGSPLAEQELVVGLKAYFNRSCSLLLLYPQERSQAEEALADGVTASSVFGVEHLLRLFVRLPQILAMTSLPRTEALNLESHLLELVEYIARTEDIFLPATAYKPLNPVVVPSTLQSAGPSASLIGSEANGGSQNGIAAFSGVEGVVGWEGVVLPVSAQNGAGVVTTNNAFESGSDLGLM